MKRMILFTMCLAVVGGCQKADSVATSSGVQADAKAFLDTYQKDFAELEKASALASWEASNSGKEEDFAKTAAARLALKKFHSNPESYKTIQMLLADKDQLDPLEERSLTVAELAFLGNQLPAEMLEEMVTLSTQIEETFNTFRGELDGEKLTNNVLLEMLAKEIDSARRKAIWETLKQTGAAVAPDLVKLAELRNKAAKQLGYANYWELMIHLQEHDPKQLLAIFDELQQVTEEPYTEMKAQLDAELAERFGIPADQMMPWHYDNPFFQAAPPSAAVDLDEFYKQMPKEKIVDLAVTFYDDIGLPIDEIVARSDLYDREGKDQHAFCTDIDRSGDVRTLCNIKPTVNWMDTMLHEQGHAVYSVNIDRSLPFNLRDSAHILTTEGIAMLFGALASNPTWLIGYAGADPDRVAEVEAAILEQRRREQLIFARWAMVMLNFEKSLYEDPHQDLNTLWWDLVEKYQHVNRPASRDLPDWAAKPHFTIAPVYYHNYMLGELFAAQLRHVLAGMAEHEGPTATLSFNGRKDFGTFLKENVFAPGTSGPWPEFVKNVTGEELTARYFAAEVK
ncbi:MAG TPA: M2 family metallopeptidase [Thermoguttaceae bacterium]|nr:M2 family metallopeptidase [Thermoguttaceae bacterium]